MAFFLKTKHCYTCKTETPVAYRVRLRDQKQWVFICKDCCTLERQKQGYTYGGTWKGTRH